MSDRRMWLVAALLLPLLWGCAAAGGGPAVAGERTARGNSVEVRVENGSGDNLLILLEQAGMERRLGTVTATRTETFRVPAAAVTGAGLRLTARPASQRGQRGTGLRSEPIPVAAGERVVWRLRDRPGVSDMPQQVSLRVY